jgi:hypothetical protein
MFGKKKEKPSLSETMNPSFNQDDFDVEDDLNSLRNDNPGDLVNQAFHKNTFNPQLPGSPLPQMNAQQQGYQIPVMQQQIQQPMQPVQQMQPMQMQQPMQQIQQPVQYVQRQQMQPRFIPTAKIVKSEETENGEFVYVVLTNYPLGLGDCQLTQ